MERRSVVAAESRCPSHPTRGRLERACNGPDFGVSKSGLTAMGLSKSQLMAARDLERGAPIGTDERVDCVLNMVLNTAKKLTRCKNPDLHGVEIQTYTAPLGKIQTCARDKIQTCTRQSLNLQLRDSKARGAKSQLTDAASRIHVTHKGAPRRSLLRRPASLHARHGCHHERSWMSVGGR